MSSFSIGQMNQFADALEKARFSADDIRKMGQNPDLLSKLHAAVNGYGNIVLKPHTIKLYDDDPSYVPEGSEVLETHSHAPYLRFNFKDLVLHAPIPTMCPADCLRFRPIKFLNANVLCFMIENQSKGVIPISWEKEGALGSSIFFIGTVFTYKSTREHFVLGMKKNKKSWEYTRRLLLSGFNNYELIAEIR